METHARISEPPCAHAVSGAPVICERFDDLGADGEPRRLGIMGGTFDPIHIGHLACAEEVREAYGLDAVVFIPAGNPVFKRDRDVTPAPERLAMCRLATESNPAFDVSSIEIDRGGDTYTVDTLRELRAHYPDNVELVFITGADAVAKIFRWRESEAVAGLARFIAVTRPGYELDDRMRETFERSPFTVDFLEVTGLSVSSSALRRRVGEGKSIRYLTMARVRDYISSHGLYRKGRNAVGKGSTAEPVDVLGEAFFDERKAELEKRVSKKRFKHVMGVVEEAELIAQAYGVDEREARLAGLLHDWDKDYDDEGIRERARELGLQVDPWILAHQPRLLHGPTAAAALGREFPDIPTGVLQAIDRHTTGEIDMTPLDMVLYCADALEPNRQFGRIDELRAMIGRATLEELYVAVLGYWTILIIEQGKTLHPRTVDIWNAYAVKNDKPYVNAKRKERK